MPQEIKTQDEGFPGEAIADLGYNIETHGQKGFNGYVAILSKLPLEGYQPRAAGDDSDEQARWIEATVVGQNAVRIAGLYLPNGNPQPGPKFDHKLAWMERLRARAQDLLKTDAGHAGRLTSSPEPRDAAQPGKWTQTRFSNPKAAPCHVSLLNGWTDAVRLRAPDASRGPFTFWDYQAGAWQRTMASASTISCCRRRLPT